jgi:dienelactone hydrolase
MEDVSVRQPVVAAESCVRSVLNREVSMPWFVRLSLCVSFLLFALCARAEEGSRAGPKVKSLQTPSGVRFALLGDKGLAPAPTLFLFATSAEDSLTNPDFAKIGHLLAKHGFLLVSLDVPCHGSDVRNGELAGSLTGWRKRLEQEDDLVPAFTRKVSAVLDHLIKEGYTDPQKVAACGTSRGGFMALHTAAAEPRIRYVVALAPVIDLLAVSEFAGMDKQEAAKALALTNHADKLAGRAVWLCIGNRDERVGTDLSIAFTRKVVAASVAQKKPANVELHVMPTDGHRIHATAHDEAAAWLLAQLRAAK